MKLTRVIPFFTVLFCSLIFNVSAADNKEINNLKETLQSRLGVNVSDIQFAPINGLYQVYTERGIIYVTGDGSKLFYGNIYDLKNGMMNLTDQAMAKPRKAIVESLQSDMLVYKAKNEKHVVTIFTDITCGYCRKLHNEMKQYNDAGITVRYLAFPRQGANSENAKHMNAIWCAKNPNNAMDKAQAGGNVKLAQCDGKISEQYQAGTRIGVTGTPAIVLKDGTLIPGYQPAKALLNTIESRS